jgi:mycofactocin precursor
MSTKKLTDVAESAEVAPVAGQVAGPVVVESLVEDVSIDGMCGVY